MKFEEDREMESTGKDATLFCGRRQELTAAPTDSLDFPDNGDIKPQQQESSNRAIQN